MTTTCDAKLDLKLRPCRPRNGIKSLEEFCQHYIHLHIICLPNKLLLPTELCIYFRLSRNNILSTLSSANPKWTIQ